MKIILPFITAFLFSVSSCTEKKDSGNENDPADSTASAVTKETPKIDTAFHDGDIIFQSSMSGQSYAIQLATHSKYSHCGLLFSDNGEWFVYEAVQPVKKTPFATWIKHGDKDYYVVKRLKNSDSLLSAEKTKSIRSSASKHFGKDYDLAFGWNDDRFYCSELVWKAYHEATGLEIGKTKPLGEFDLSNPVVQKKLKERYGNKIPKDEPMISPGSIFESELLITIRE